MKSLLYFMMFIILPATFLGSEFSRPRKKYPLLKQSSLRDLTYDDTLSSEFAEFEFCEPDERVFQTSKQNPIKDAQDKVSEKEKTKSTIELIEINDSPPSEEDPFYEAPLERHMRCGWRLVVLRSTYMLLERDKEKSFSLSLPVHSNFSSENEPDCYLHPGYERTLEYWRGKECRQGISTRHLEEEKKPTYINLIQNDTMFELGNTVNYHLQQKHLEMLSDLRLKKNYENELEKINIYTIAFNHYIKSQKYTPPIKIQPMRAFICTLEMTKSKRPNPLLAEKYYIEIERRAIVKRMSKINKEFERLLSLENDDLEEREAYQNEE